jgi:hypothetical protein
VADDPVTTYQVLAWRGIPAAVEARDEQETVTRPLSERFQMLIDSAAAQLGFDDEAGYLEHWTRSEPSPHAGTAREAAEAVITDLEGRFEEFIAAAFRRS